MLFDNCQEKKNTDFSTSSVRSDSKSNIHLLIFIKTIWPSLLLTVFTDVQDPA